jgi:hypothetical protein
MGLAVVGVCAPVEDRLLAETLDISATTFLVALK